MTPERGEAEDSSSRSATKTSCCKSMERSAITEPHFRLLLTKIGQMVAVVVSAAACCASTSVAELICFIEEKGHWESFENSWLGKQPRE